MEEIKIIAASLILLELFVELDYNDPHTWASKVLVGLSVASVAFWGYCLQGISGGAYGALYWLLFRFGVFSPAWAYGRGKEITYLGTRSPVDRFESRFSPRRLILVRFVSLLAFVLI